MLRFLTICIMAFAGYYFWAFFPITHGPGITADKAPTTARITWEKPFTHLDYTIIPLRKIESKARVIDHKRYFFDAKSSYSPSDILVGWGDLSDERNLDHLHFSISNRMADIDFSRPPLPITQIYQQTAFWHLVPSNEAIDKEIKKIKKGNLVTIKGFIVDVESEVYYGWKSDLITNNNAQYPNTIIWVSEITVK